MYRRPQHAKIVLALTALDAPLLLEAKCYFAGGTAISLQLDEYRRSDDIDFLCADADGYRRLRESVFDHGLKEIFPHGIDVLREHRSDQYGIRAILRVDGQPIKFEIIREGRIQLAGAAVPDLPVPCLAREDLYTERLLANVDRYLDGSALSRDILDLMVMERRWGPIPTESWKKAEQAYGAAIKAAYAKAKQALRENRVLFEDRLRSLDFDESTAEELRSALGSPTPSRPITG
jgi:hypothetical protein